MECLYHQCCKARLSNFDACLMQEASSPRYLVKIMRDGLRSLTLGER